MCRCGGPSDLHAELSRHSGACATLPTGWPRWHAASPRLTCTQSKTGDLIPRSEGWEECGAHRRTSFPHIRWPGLGSDLPRLATQLLGCTMASAGGKMLSAEERRRQKELEEARKAGLAAPEVTMLGSAMVHTWRDAHRRGHSSSACNLSFTLPLATISNMPNTDHRWMRREMPSIPISHNLWPALPGTSTTTALL